MSKPEFSITLLVTGGPYWTDTSPKELFEHFKHYIETNLFYELRENDIEINIIKVEDEENDNKHSEEEWQRCYSNKK